MTKKELIQEARQRVAEIAKATKSCHCEKRTVIYESDNGVTVSHIQLGWNTFKNSIDFGRQPMTKKQVLSVIEEAEEMEFEFNQLSKF